jgi:hypothetical protein
MSHRARDEEKQDEKNVIVGTQKCRRKRQRKIKAKLIDRID